MYFFAFIYRNFTHNLFIEATSTVDVVGSEDTEERNIKKKKFKKCSVCSV